MCRSGWQIDLVDLRVRDADTRSWTSTWRPTPTKTGPLCDVTSRRSVGPAYSIAPGPVTMAAPALSICWPESSMASSGPMKTAAAVPVDGQHHAEQHQQPPPKFAHRCCFEPV